MSKKTIYIAGPMRGRPEWNYPRFNRWADALRSDGWEVINPVEMSDVPPEILERKPHLLQTLMAREIHELQYRADALFLLEGWEKSVGARNELKAFLLANGAEDPTDRPIFVETLNHPPILKEAVK